MRVLVTGFGSFPGVSENPTESLALELDGQRIGEHEIWGVVLPVSYDRGPAQAIRLARELRADLVIGFGVAVTREQVCVERRAVHVAEGERDNDGQIAAMTPGPFEVLSTLDAEGLALVLGGSVSEDAGRYVCNAWLYKVADALDVPVGFVHIPASGVTAAEVLDALRRWL